jgi:hypothetical protein
MTDIRLSIITDLRFSQITKYNNIYKNTYWGKHSGIVSKSIIHARNWFVLKYKIVSYKKCPEKYSYMRQDLDLDHTETYEDIQGRLIYLYSMWEDYGRVKFNQIYSMYERNQYSAIQIFETTKSIKLMIKKIKERLPDELNKIIRNFLNGDKLFKML